MTSPLLTTLRREARLLSKTYLGFSARPAGNYSMRQLSAGAAYTVFCHAEFETYFEGWALRLTDLAWNRWSAGKVSRPLLHLCSFNGGRNELSSVPKKDIWSEIVVSSIRKHQQVVKGNHGVREANISRLLGPLGFDLRKIDPILLADLDAFSSMRGAHAHQTHSVQLKTVVDPFDRKAKAEGLLHLVAALDNDLVSFEASA